MIRDSIKTWTIDLIDEYLVILRSLLKDQLYKHPIEAQDRELEKGKPPVILLPGYNEGYYFMEGVDNFLNQQGINTYYPKSHHPRQNMIKVADNLIAEFVENNFDNLTIIAHSRGSIIALLTMMKKPELIGKIICIAPPLRGSIWANLRVFNLDELLPNSVILEKVRQNLPSLSSKLHFIYPAIDNQVPGNKLVETENVRNYELRQSWHTRVLFTQELYTVIFKILEEN